MFFVGTMQFVMRNILCHLPMYFLTTFMYFSKCMKEEAKVIQYSILNLLYSVVFTEKWKQTVVFVYSVQLVCTVRYIAWMKIRHFTSCTP